MRIFTLLLSFVFFTAVSAQKLKDTSFTCTAHWKKGEQKVLLIARHKESTNNGDASQPFNLAYEAHITVLDANSDGYSIQWVYSLPDSFKKANPEFAESLLIYNGLKVVFSLNPSGLFKELKNWQEVRDAYLKTAMMSFPKDKMDSSLLQKITDMFNTKKMVETTLIKEVRIYYSIMGGNFHTEGRSVQTDLATPMIDKPLPAIQEFK